ncbi:MAG: hypothetical protein HQL95_04170 [Magnetococcales bacterium]|nr:hypothetical protein [Magnetococcales bacterium]
MSRYQWAPYVPVAERRRQAMREMEKLRKKGQSVTPLVISSRAIATTFWGKAWCANQEMLAHLDTAVPLAKKGPRAEKLLERDDIYDLFGIEMAAGTVGSREPATPRSTAKVAGKPMPTKTQMPLRQNKENNCWQEVEERIAIRNVSGYVKAMAKLIDLRDRTRESQKMTEFSKRLATLRVRHKNKSRLIMTLNAAGLS